MTLLLRLIIVATSLATAADSASVPKIVFVGDSLTEGLGVPRNRAYPAVIGEKLKAKGKEVEIVNTGVGGATTAGADRKVRWALKGKPTVLVLALGANDALRGLSLEVTRKNLEDAVAEVKKSGVKFLLVGMKAPPNMGPDYTSRFENIFRDLAKKHDLKFVPFLLKDVGGETALNQADGIHPNEAGHEKMADTVMKGLEPLL